MIARLSPLIRILRPAALVIGLSAALAGGLHSLGYGIVYQTTDSMPRGFYWLVPSKEARLGSLVTLAAPGKPGLVLLKRIAAVKGDRVCLDGHKVLIAGRQVAEALPEGPSPIPLCRALLAEEVFLLGDGPRSFDSRYFGPVERHHLAHRAIPL